MSTETRHFRCPFAQAVTPKRRPKYRRCSGAKQTGALSRRRVLKRSSQIRLTIQGKSTTALIEVPNIANIVKYAVRTATVAARLWVQSKYILDITIYMKPKRSNRDIYVVKLTTKKTTSTTYLGSREGYQLYPIRYRKLSTVVRGKYKVHGVRRKVDDRKRRRILAVTALIKLGYGKLPQTRGGTPMPKSAGGYPGGTALINPGAPAARPAGPGLPAGGDAADYD